MIAETFNSLPLLLFSFGRLPTSSGASNPTAISSADNILTTDWTTLLKDYIKNVIYMNIIKTK